MRVQYLHYIITVSYTHLDVYKRQGVECSPDGVEGEPFAHELSISFDPTDTLHGHNWAALLSFLSLLLLALLVLLVFLLTTHVLVPFVDSTGGVIKACFWAIYNQ